MPLQYILCLVVAIPSVLSEFCSVAVTLILESVIFPLAFYSSMYGCRVARWQHMIQKAPTIAVMITPAMGLAWLLFGFSVVSSFSFSFFCSLSALKTTCN